MKRIQLKILRKEILVPIVLGTAILLLTLGVLMGMRAKAVRSAALASKAESLGRYLERAGVQHILNFDPSLLKAIASRAAMDPEVVSIVYYDAEGKVLTRSGRKTPISENALVWERELKDPGSRAIVGRMKCAFSPGGLASPFLEDLVSLTAALGGGGLLVAVSLGCLVRRRIKSSDPEMDETADRLIPIAVASQPAFLRPHEVVPPRGAEHLGPPSIG
jgi:hypothetical protein